MTVDDFLNVKEQNRAGLTQLRGVLLELGFQETVKWNFPVYTFQNKNIIGLGSFSNYFGLWFFQGGLLQDKAGVLVNAQEGKTQAMRQWRFKSADEIDIDLVRSYILEALDNHKVGLEIKPQKKPLIIPPELQTALNKDAELNERFSELSLTYKREFAEYIGEAKRAETKDKRLEKIIPMILDKIGLNDKYR